MPMCEVLGARFICRGHSQPCLCDQESRERNVGELMNGVRNLLKYRTFFHLSLSLSSFSYRLIILEYDGEHLVDLGEAQRNGGSANVDRGTLQWGSRISIYNCQAYEGKDEVLTADRIGDLHCTSVRLSINQSTMDDRSHVSRSSNFLP